MSWPPGAGDLLARLNSGRLDARGITALLVPLERALQRKVRDEDLLPSQDHPSRQVAAMPVTLVAENLRSSFNTGGLLRSAECFGVERVLLCGYTAGPEDPRVRKAALGCEDHVAWERVRDARQPLEAVRASGGLCAALETEPDARPLDEAPWTFPLALVVGNERYGLDPETRERADFCVRIPMHGIKNSLNVVVAAGIALAAIRRAWEARGEEPASS